MSILNSISTALSRVFSPPPPPPPPERAVHEVQRHETFDQIGARYNVQADALLKANPHLGDPSLLAPGERLNIPLNEPGASLPGLLQLGTGQTLDDVATQYGSSVDTLMRANGIDNAGTVYPSDRIWVPGADVVPLTTQQLQADPAKSPYNTSVQPLSQDATKVHAELQGYKAAVDNYRAGDDPAIGSKLWQEQNTRSDALNGAVRNELQGLAAGPQAEHMGVPMPGKPLTAENLDQNAQQLQSRYVNDPQAQQILSGAIESTRTDLRVEAEVPYITGAPDQASFDSRLKSVQAELSPDAQVRLAAQPGIASQLETRPNYLTPAQQQALVTRDGPEMRLHPAESNEMEDPSLYASESSLREERFGPDKEVYSADEMSPENLREIKNSENDISLDHGDSTEARAGNNDRARTIYEYDEQNRTMTYHQFYAYNDGPGPQNHEGDWEAVTIKYDADFKPTDMYFSGHGGATHRDWNQVEKTTDGHPVTYVALGTHANSPEPGIWPTAVYGVNDVSAGGGEVVKLSELPMTDVTTEPYYGSDVMWGERGSLKEIGVGDTSGPTGPSAAKLEGLREDNAEADQKSRAEGDQQQVGTSLLQPILNKYGAYENLAQAVRSPISSVTDNPPLPLRPGYLP